MPNNITDYLQAMHEGNQYTIPAKMSVGELINALQKFDKNEIVRVEGSSTDDADYGALIIGKTKVLEYINGWWD